MTTASTKRNPSPINGVVGPAVTNLSSLALSFAPYPISPETALKYKLDSPRKTYVTGVHGTPPDVLEGDLLTADSVTYVVRAVGKWLGSPVEYTKIYMEKQM